MGNFVWKLKELKLYKELEDAKEKGLVRFRDKYIFCCENELSKETKLAFADSMLDNKLSYIISVCKKFEEDVESLPKDKWGDVKTVSLKAWLKRNDPRNLFDKDYSYGFFVLIGCKRSIKNALHRHGVYDIHDDLVDEVFHRLLSECELKEQKYFHEHDEYSILKKRLREEIGKTNIQLIDNLVFCSDGEILIKSYETKEERPISIDEIKILLGKYKQIDNLTEKRELLGTLVPSSSLINNFVSSTIWQIF